MNTRDIESELAAVVAEGAALTESFRRCAAAMEGLTASMETYGHAVWDFFVAMSPEERAEWDRLDAADGDTR